MADAIIIRQGNNASGDSGGKLAQERYTRVAIMLHWTIAILILFNLAVGFFMEGLPPAIAKVVITAHLSSGISVLALTFVRVIWRLAHRPPPLLSALHAWERHLATLVHLLFYAGMIVMPLSGWAIISANPPTGSKGAAFQQSQADAATARGERAPPPRVSGKSRLWWLAPLPPIAPLANIGLRPEGLEKQHRLHELSAELHTYLAYVMIALLLLHVGGALKHEVLDRQPQLARMGLILRIRTNAG